MAQQSEWDQFPEVKTAPADNWDQFPEGQKEEPSLYDQYVKPVGDFAGDVYDYVVGKQDPRYKDLPAIDSPKGFDMNTPLYFDELSRAQVFGATDAQYLGIIKKQLGENFVGHGKDENGFDIIAYRGRDGKIHQRYLNKPGLDWQDVNRGVQSAFPYLAAGGAVGLATRGAPLLAKAGAQALGQAGASVAQDTVAHGMGSEQGVSGLKAGIAAAGGAVGELAGPFIARLFQNGRPSRKLVDESGKLTARGQFEVKKAGLDPDLIEGELAKEFARRAQGAKDPGEALLQAQTSHFGIPTSKGQRTKDPQLLLTEKDLRVGTLGQGPKAQMQEFDRQQAMALENAVRGRVTRPQTSPGNQFGPIRPERDGIAPMLAPHRNLFEQNPAQLGSGIQRGFNSAVKSAKGKEDDAWAKFTDVTARQGATDNIQDYVGQALKGFRVVEQQHPTAVAMLNEIKRFQSGAPPIPGTLSEWLGQGAITKVGEMRKNLLAFMRTASPQNGERIAARRIYQGYQDWLDDTASKGFLTGDVKSVQSMRNAMDVTKEVRKLIKPTDLGGRKTQVTRVFEKLEGAETGEEVVNVLLGASGPRSNFRIGGAEALKTYKNLVMRHGGPLGREAWDDVRLAYWLKAVTGKDGELLGPQALFGNLRSIMHTQGSIVRELYSPSEIRQMRKLVSALKVITFKDPNPSGSGTAVRGLFPELAAQAAETQAKRELFSKHNVLMSRLYRSLAKVIRGAEKPAGGAAANRATSQRLTPKPQPSAGGYGGALAVQGYSDR